MYNFFNYLPLSLRRLINILKIKDASFLIKILHLYVE